MITGSLQTKKGIYYAVLNVYDEYGKRKPKWIPTGIKAIRGNKKKAESKLEKIKAEYKEPSKFEENNTDILEKYTDMLFCDYMLEWLETHKNKVEQTTYIGYEQVVKGRLYNYFKDKKIKLIDLKAKHIQQFYDSLYNDGLSGNTVKHYRANITKALRSAVITEIIPTNPAEKLEAIKVKEYTADFYNADETLKLIDLAKDTDVYLPVILASIYGLRRSEVLGIKWNAIDFNDKTLTIRHTVGRGKINGVTQFIFKDRAKSQAGYRTLPLFDFVADLLLLYKNTYKENRKFYGKSYCNEYSEYVCLMDNGELMKPDYLTRKFEQLLENNKMRKIRLHDLRHSCGTLLIRNKVPLKEIQNWLGHSSYQTTLRYAHADIENKVLSANIITDKLDLAPKKEQITQTAI